MTNPRIKLLALIIIIVLIIPAMASCIKVQAPNGQAAGNGIGITSLTPSQNQTFPGGTVYIQSMVNNPKNETLVFKWSCTGGNFSDSGSNNTWIAPSQYGSYNVTLTIEDGKGGQAQSTVIIAVAANRPPVINSLTTSQANVMYGGITNLTCDAVDPDGDALRYSWSASEGSISGVGKTVTWVSPNKGGDYNIWVIVSDGKAESRRNVVVTVMAATNTTTIALIRNESGTVSKSGDKDTSRYRAGDDEKNDVYRCFFSFNVFSLNGHQVTNAKLKFGPARVAGDPFASVTGLNGLRLWKVKYGEGLPQFDTLGEALDRAGGLLPSAPVEVDVTPEVTNAAASAAERFQVETLFDKPTNGNNIAQFVEFTDVILEVTFAPR